MFEMKRRGWQKTLQTLRTILADETKLPNVRVNVALAHVQQAMGEKVKIPPTGPFVPPIAPEDQPRRRSMRSKMFPGIRMIGPLGKRIEVPQTSWDIIVREMQNGHKIQAIKEIRTAMTFDGVVPGLKECKDLIDGDVFLQNVYRPAR